MVKGSREGLLTKIQPMSVHGQISLDVHYVLPDDVNGQVQVARLGPEAVETGLEPGDRIKVEFLLGVATSVTKVRA